MHQETQQPSSDVLKNLPQEQLIQLLTQLIQQQQSSSNQLNRITIDELCDKHLRIAKSREYSKNSIEKIGSAHQYFREYVQKKGFIYTDEITYDHAEEFYIFLINHNNPTYGKRKDARPKLSRIYVIAIYKHIKAMFAIAEKRNHIYKNQFENKPYPQRLVTEWWTDDYVHNKLIPAIRNYKSPNKGKTPNAKLTELKIMLTYTTGLRPGIIHRIKRKDVKITEDREVIVNTDAKIPKSSKWQHHVAELLNEECKEMFIKHINKLDRHGINPEDLILATPKTTAGYNQYRYHITQACKQANIPYLTPHKAKHGFITKMAQAGMTSNKICKITGNKTARLIDEVYTHISQKDARNEAYKALNNK